MLTRKLIVAVALMSLAGAARAGYVSALSEPATVTLIFMALATIGFAMHRKRAEPADA